MIAMSSQIEIFQEMSALSAQMVEAAQAHDWDRLVILEESVAALRSTLISEGTGPALGPGEQNIKAALIQRILDDDAEIRRHTEPWMEHVRQFLGGNHNRRRVEQAYGA